LLVAARKRFHAGQREQNHRRIEDDAAFEAEQIRAEFVKRVADHEIEFVVITGFERIPEAQPIICRHHADAADQRRQAE